MNLDIDNWKSFKVNKILTIYNGRGITTEEIELNPGNFTVVQSGEENNGVLGKISLNYCESMEYTYTEKPCLTVARSGSAGFVSFQKNGCVVGDSAKILLLDDEIASTEVYVFIQTILTANRFKYTYGRKVTETKYMNDIIDLPVKHNDDGSIYIDKDCKYTDEGYVPDWQFMEQYIKDLHYKPIKTDISNEQYEINIDEWKEFIFGNLIDEPYKGKCINKDDVVIAESENNSIHYITRTAEDNGCELNAQLSEVDPDYIEDGNAITIGDTTATCFYQEKQFITGDHMVVVRAPWLNKYNAMFIVGLLTREQYKYSYGRAYLKGRIKETIIKLPVKRDKSNNIIIDEEKKYSSDGYIPDWEFMEQYIKKLPYSDRL